MAQFILTLSTQHFIAHRSIPTLSQHTTLYRPPLNSSPLSAHNTVSPTAQFLPPLTIKLYRPPLDFSPLSAQHFIAHSSISPLSQHTKLNRPPLNFSPLSAHNTESSTSLFLPLSAHNSESPTSQFLPSLNTQH